MTCPTADNSLRFLSDGLSVELPPNPLNFQGDRWFQRIGTVGELWNPRRFQVSMGFHGDGTIYIIEFFTFTSKVSKIRKCEDADPCV